MGGIAGFVALFVVAGTFALAIAQRRRETAVLRALGATPRQVRRLIATEALFVSLVAGALGLLAGRPLATALVDLLVEPRRTSRRASSPGTRGSRWSPRSAMGIGIAQLAVVAAARRAGKVRARRGAARGRRSSTAASAGSARLSGVLALGGGAAMALLFKGEQASAFSILAGILLAAGHRAARALAARAARRAARPAAARSRPRRAAGEHRACRPTAGARLRWRRRSC